MLIKNGIYPRKYKILTDFIPYRYAKNAELPIKAKYISTKTNNDVKKSFI
jgi:hypothetical protein